MCEKGGNNKYHNCIECNEKYKLELYVSNYLNCYMSNEIHNFNNPLGTATKKPLLIAEADGRKVFISISVEAIGEIKLVSFSFDFLLN